MDDTASIVKLDQATRMLAEIRDVDDAIQLIDLAEAARVYAKQVKLGLEAQNHATEIKLRAQRRAGEILDGMEKAKGAQMDGRDIFGGYSVKPPNEAPTYGELGIDKRDAHVWQTIAAMPEEVFEREIATAKDTDKELSTAAIYREARQITAQDKPPAPELPKDKYAIIYADPPWRYDFSRSDSREIENQYPTMTLDELKALDIPGLAAADCVLLMWATSPKLREAIELIQAWGFDYKTSMVWVKDKIGMGYYARQMHELLLIAGRGSLPVPDPENRPASVINAPRTNHSKKPDEVYRIIDRMYPGVKKIELFARAHIENWDTWGNE